MEANNNKTLSNNKVKLKMHTKDLIKPIIIMIITITINFTIIGNRKHNNINKTIIFIIASKETANIIETMQIIKKSKNL